MIIRLTAGDATVAIDSEAGGRLSSLIVGGNERLVTRMDPTAPYPELSWGSFVMVPWVGRMQEGRLRWRLVEYALPADYGAHAIHGAAYDLPWAVVSASQTEAVLDHAFVRERWPFRGRVTQRVTLGPDSLEQEVIVDAQDEMPVAVGWHPWFTRRDVDVRVRVDASRALITLGDMIPTGTVDHVRGPADLREGPLLGDRQLDLAYVEVAADPVITWPDLELTLSNVPGGTLQVYTPQGSVCVEPQSAWPDAIRLSAEHPETGLRIALPGEPLRFATRWTWRTPAA